MSDYFERLEGELRGAVQRGVGTAATVTAPGNRAPGGWVAIALGAVATAAVVVAIAVLGIGRDGGSQGGIPAGAHSLLARLRSYDGRRRRPTGPTLRGCLRRCRAAATGTSI